MTATIEHLRRDHTNFARLLDILERQVDIAYATGRPSLELVKLILLYFREYPCKIHHPKENLIYNALLLHKPKGADKIFDVIAEHRDLSERMEQVERAVDGLDLDAPASIAIFCHQTRKFIDDEREHIIAEEMFLYPNAAGTLTPEEWAGIDHFMGNSADPLFGDAVSGPFVKLADAIFDIDSSLTAAEERYEADSAQTSAAAS